MEKLISNNSSKMSSFLPVILCGGSGTRLWPISTPKIPKQLISLGNKGTLLEQTLKRVDLISDKCNKYGIKSLDPILIMHKDHNLPKDFYKKDIKIIYEEYANDTAVAVARLAKYIKDNYNDTTDIIITVLPADHYIYNTDQFIKDIFEGILSVNFNNIVLYGLDPTSPETKYGYILPTNPIKFIEKPEINVAIELLNNNALWNSGIFSAYNNLIYQLLEINKYNIFNWIDNPREGKAPSFDIAILQEHNEIYAKHCNGWQWSDVGTWESFTQIPEIKMEINNNISNIMKHCDNTQIINRTNKNIVAIGCSNLLVVNTDSDILILSTEKDYNNDLKQIASSII